MLNLRSALEHYKFIKNKPLVIGKIFNGFFRTLILRQNLLRTVDLCITYNCHYKCKFCSAALLQRPGKSVITPEQVKELWKQATKLGAIHVNLTGGEPFARNIDELCEIIKALDPKKTLISLVTNSALVTEEKLKRVRAAGLDTIQLSIESLNPEKNDDIRGVPGITKKTLDVFKWAKELGMVICLSMVLTHDNKEDVEELLAFVEKNDAFLLLNPISSVGNWRGNESNKILEEDKKIFDNYMKNKRIRNDTSFNFTLKRGCPGGKERIHVTAYGDVITCPLVQVSYGNILEEPLAKIHKRMGSLPFIKEDCKYCKQAFDVNYHQSICKPSEEITNPPMSIYKHPISKDPEVSKILDENR